MIDALSMGSVDELDCTLTKRPFWEHPCVSPTRKENSYERLDRLYHGAPVDGHNHGLCVPVDDAYQRLIAKHSRSLRRSAPEPTFLDSEVIKVSLITEAFFQGHEELGYAFVSQYLQDLVPNPIDLDRFNVRRRELIAVIEAIRKGLRDQRLY
jgi:hypothetical protein